MKVVIVGGGSAGWMTASYLSHVNKDIEIVLVESNEIDTVGVGEATTPYLMRFFESIGIKDEKEWMPHCNATYKNGVLYDSWDFVNSRWWHSFEVDEHKYPYWDKLRQEQGLDRQDYYLSTMYNSHIAMRDSAKWMADKDGKVNVPYYHSRAFNGWGQHWAYHLDSGLFGKFLKNRCKDNITHIVTNVNNVSINDDGIEKLETDTGDIVGDIYVDCTGFSRLLISEVSDKPLTSLSPYLTHDKAVVIRHDYLDKDTEMRPRTRAKCLSSGWYWDIPLYDKLSNGYVYTSSFISDEDAEEELRQEIGYERTKNCEARVIDIKTGYYDETFKKNVLAVGLSAGFIEPLESTLLFVIQLAGIRLNNYLNGELSKEEINEEYNSNLQDYLDYISVGYYLSHRNDTPFWRYIQENAKISDKMREWIDDCKEELQPPEQGVLFVDSSWISKAIGFNLQGSKDKKFRTADMELIKSQMQHVKDFDYSSLLSQNEYLKRFIYE